MSLSRLFTIVVVIGLVAGAALTIRSAGTTSAAAESIGTTARGNMAEGIIELHKRQELAADSTVASVAASQGNMAEGILELHRHQELAADSTVAGSGIVRGNMAQGIIELHRRQELAGENAASNAGVEARWAAMNEAYRRQYDLASIDQADRLKVYWAAANEEYRKRYGLSG